MSRFQRILQGLGWEGWTLIFCGLAAVLIAVLDFVQLINLNTDNTLRLILMAIGLLLSAVAAQTSLRKADLQELNNALGITSAELIGSKRTFHSHVRQSVYDAKKFVLHTMLTYEYASFVHPLDRSYDFTSALFERISRKELSYRRVEVVLNRERLEYLVYRLLLYEGMDYLVRYYRAPPNSIPVLNILSIDNEKFYLGGFYTGDAPVDAWSAVCIKNRETGSLLEAYWNNLWLSAKPLNESKRINWEELQTIASSLGLAEDEFKVVVDKAREKIQRRKRSSRYKYQVTK